MKIAIIAIGSRGDAQPCIAVGVRLKADGHTVRIATHRIFEAFVCEYGLEFRAVEGNPQEILQTEGGQSWIESGRNPMSMLARMRELATPIVDKLTRDCLAACQDTDLILFSTLGFFAGQPVAEKLKVPAMGIYTVPISPTRENPAIMAPPLPDWLPSQIQGFYNRFTHDAYNELNWLVFKQPINSVREKVLDLPPITSSFRKLAYAPTDIAYGYSPCALPKPGDWGERLHITGYWFLKQPDDWHPPKGLAEFLDSGEPPIYIGFGSMMYRNPEQTTEIVLEAIRRSKQRAIILSGWAGIGNHDVPDEVCVIDNAPHDWLFPQVKAVIHHGGAGTTAAGLRAGKPSIIIPHFADQPFWGHRIKRLGVGPDPIQRKHLNSDRLVDAIRATIVDEGMQKRARHLGQKIQSEDGVGNLARLIERIFA